MQLCFHLYWKGFIKCSLGYSSILKSVKDIMSLIL
jgi:hypothetical protein